MFLGRKVIGNFASLGKKVGNDLTGLGRKANVAFRQISNTSNQIGDALGKTQNVLEKASTFNPALKVVADGVGTLKAGTGVVSGLSNTGRGIVNGSPTGILNGLNQTATSGTQFTTGVVKTGLPVMML